MGVIGKYPHPITHTSPKPPITPITLITLITPITPTPPISPMLSPSHTPPSSRSFRT